MTNNDKIGDKVFANIDEVLAGKIISRSKENAGVGSEEIGNGNGVAYNGDNGQSFRREPKSIPVIRIAMAVAAALFLAKFILMRGGRRNG